MFNGYVEFCNRSTGSRSTHGRRNSKISHRISRCAILNPPRHNSGPNLPGHDHDPLPPRRIQLATRTKSPLSLYRHGWRSFILPVCRDHNYQNGHHGRCIRGYDDIFDDGVGAKGDTIGGVVVDRVGHLGRSISLGIVGTMVGDS